MQLQLSEKQYRLDVSSLLFVLEIVRTNVILFVSTFFGFTCSLASCSSKIYFSSSFFVPSCAPSYRSHPGCNGLCSFYWKLFCRYHLVCSFLPSRQISFSFLLLSSVDGPGVRFVVFSTGVRNEKKQRGGGLWSSCVFFLILCRAVLVVASSVATQTHGSMKIVQLRRHFISNLCVCRFPSKPGGDLISSKSIVKRLQNALPYLVNGGGITLLWRRTIDATWLCCSALGRDETT